MFKPALFLTAVVGTSVICGCYKPGGGMFSHTGGPQTYMSTEMMQKTITMIDSRNGQPFFVIDIPPAKQLTIDFEEGQGDDPVMTPDLMRWEIMDRGTTVGKLHNAQSVPSKYCRKIDVELHAGVKYPTQSAQDRSLRTDEMNDRPAWWTPEGGPLPKDERTQMYD